MTEAEFTDQGSIPDISKPEPFKWALSIWFKPAATFRKIIASDGKTWWFPMALLSGLQIIKSIIEIPVRKAAIMMAPAPLPQGMNYISPEQQAQIDQSLVLKSGPFFTFIVPVLLALAGIWITWLLLSSILHISLTMSGSRSNSRTTFNIAAWASLPLALRTLVQAVSILATKMLIEHPGNIRFHRNKRQADPGGFDTTGDDRYLLYPAIALPDRRNSSDRRRESPKSDPDGTCISIDHHGVIHSTKFCFLHYFRDEHHQAILLLR